MVPVIALSISVWLRDFQGEGLFPSPGQFRPATVEYRMNRIADYIVAVALGLILAALALSYFDVLTK